MMHLTLTGYCAGVPICGLLPSEAAARGDSFEHPAYSTAGIERQLADAYICPTCRAAWLGEDETGEDAPR